MTRAHETNLNLSAGLMSVAVALLLVLAKLWALAATGSLSVAATLADSGLDLMMSLGGLAAIAYAAKPADEDHPFGHTSAEDLAALGQALFILAAAGVIAVAAVRRLISPDVSLPRDEGAGIAVMVFSILLTLALVWWQRRVARKTGNRVVMADSLHYVGDMIPSIGAIVALWAAARYNLGQIDSVFALGAAAFLASGAVRIGKQAWDALMDRQADPAMIEDIARITGNFPGIHGFHDLKTRVSGSRVFVNMHVELDGSKTLNETHAIGAALRRAITAAHPRADVLIHQDPVGVTKHPEDTRG
ncbi:MAG: cation diffusion facilitator family transporter [Limimaricola sp.]|uniref:cation diffusion facilitator family transporter n=1 Tax=Limimaricola sp. TaxID=2211665 RepID=UPI001DFBD3F9|nr:cation diffusion facilitator family transporter [Limimaricola sp.]MBI1417748.1 cation diffusion facilitator family transporter [Limimaricola sp.]